MTRDLNDSRFIQFIALLAFAMVTAACASAGHGSPQSMPQTGSVSEPTEEKTTEPIAEAEPPAGTDDTGSELSQTAFSEKTPDRTRREPLPEIVVDVRSRMEEAYQSGLEAHMAGRFDEAREYFDFAVDVVLSSGIDLDEQRALKRKFDEIVRNISDLDADLYSREAAGMDSGSPLDSLQDITSFLSPKEAERERHRIEEHIGEVTYDLPMVLNPNVLSFVELFRTRLREEFTAGLKRSGGYLPIIKKMFREAGIPEDLAYMAHQESAFKNNAYSRARAKGMWQFMSFTGRKYGLKQDIWVDERSDFEKATRSAAAYLKDNYARFGDWYLAMAAYNAGEGKIGRAIRSSGSKDFWKIARTRYIRRETKNYIPAILASILIDKSPEDYGFYIDIDPVLRWDTVDLDKPTDLQVIAEATDATLDEIRHLNPELRGLITPPNVPTYKVRVPKGKRIELIARLETLTDEERASWTRHIVRQGENFTRISQQYKVPLRAVLDANPRYAKRRLQPGTVINVPFSGGLPALQQVRSREDRPSYERGERVVHRVRRGDTLGRIARKYHTNVKNLERWNGIRGSLIRPGQRIVAYYGEKGSGSTVTASRRTNYEYGERLVHKVRRGDNLSKIAGRYRTTVKNLKRWNNLQGSMLKPGQKITAYYGEKGSGPHDAASGTSPVTVTKSRIQYRVQRGDNLTTISRKFGVSVREVCRWNGLTPRSVIYPGDDMWIGDRAPDRVAQNAPANGTIAHRVRRGENLYRIAQKYNVSVEQVQSWNNLGSQSRIYPGQLLHITID